MKKIIPLKPRILSATQKNLLRGIVFGFCFTNYWITGLLWRLGLVIPVLYGFLNSIMHSNNRAEAFKFGTGFGFGFFFLSLCDLKKAFDFMQISLWGIFCVFFFAAGLSLFVSMPCFFARFFSKGRKILGAFSILFGIGEYVRSEIFPQIPLNVMYSLFSLDSSGLGDYMIQGAEFFLYPFSTLLIWFCGSFKHKFGLVLSSFGLICLFGFGYYKISHLSLPSDYIKVSLIQPNIDQSRKLDPHQNAAIFQEILNLIEQVQNDEERKPTDMPINILPALFKEISDFDQFYFKRFGFPIQCIILPESAIPGLITEESPEIKALQQALHSEKTVLIFGADRKAIHFGKTVWHNSLFVVSKKEILAIYDKAKLLPFGEYIPGRSYCPKWLKNFCSGIDAVPGNEFNKIVFLKSIPAFLPKICSESLFFTPKQFAALWGLTILNDGWFGPSIKAQHLAIDRLQAVRNRIPIVRVSNNGISVVMDAASRIQKRLPENQVAYTTIFVALGRQVILDKHLN